MTAARRRAARRRRPAGGGAGPGRDWAALARELGFSDQAHLVRVFAQVVGTPPASYQRAL
jgi:AraC-like DNA-binding protein